MPTILIGGYYGAGNVGDEAILTAMVGELRAQYKNHIPLTFIVLSWDPEKTSRELDVEATHWKDINGMVQAARRSDLIIVGGGGIFFDYWGLDPDTYLRKGAWDITAFGSLPLLAKLLDIPCMIYGVGIGPLETSLARQHTRLAFERCQIATIRDEESFALLKQTGFNPDNPQGPKVFILPDPVFGLTSSKADDLNVATQLGRLNISPETPLLGVSLRFWDRPIPPQEWLTHIAAGVRDFLEKNDHAQAVLFPFQVLESNTYTNDTSILKQLAQLVSIPERVHIFEKSLSVKFVQALINRCNVLLTMRLHGIIMGVNAGTPMVALSSWPKIPSTMKIIGMEEFCNTSLTPDPTVLTTQLQNSWDSRKELSSNLLNVSVELRQKASEHARLALELMARSHRTSLEFPQEFALEQIRLLQKADEAYEVLEKERFSLQTRVWDLAGEIQNKNAELNRLRNGIQELLTQVQDRDGELREQKVMLAAQSQENSLDQPTGLVEQLRTEVEKKDSELNQQKSHILELEALLQNPENEIHRLRTRLADIESSHFWKLALKYYHLMGSTPLHHLYDLGSKLLRKRSHRAVRSVIKTRSENLAVDKKEITAGEVTKSILKTINAGTFKGVFIITSAFVFDEFYNQRVTNLAKYLAKEGWGVIYVAWRWSKDEIIPGSGEEVYPNIFQIPVDMFLESLGELEGVVHARKYFAVEFPHPEFFVAAIRLRRYGFPIIYEIIDDWEEFHKVGQATWYQQGVEEAFVVNANVLTAVSQPLVDKFAGIRKDIHLSPNGYNPLLLGEESQGIARNKFQGSGIRVGYFGHLTDAWFDWDLILRVVDLARERGVKVRFDLIGYGNPDLEERLEKYRDNVRLHGKVQPAELHAYVREWDVAMIPFKKGKLSQAVDPLKIYEYLYFGLGVIVTGIEHLKALPRVEVVGDAEEFLGALMRMREAALGGTGDTEEERVAEVLRQATWEARFSRMVEILEAGKWMSL